MKLPRFYPVLLTAMLQIMPLMRVAVTDQPPCTHGVHILFRWAGGAMALLGGLHAVAGASTSINSPTNIVRTNGVTYTSTSPLYRVTLANAQDAIFTATPLSPGLVMNTNINNGRITGTSSNFLGTMIVEIRATDPNGQYPTPSQPYITTNLYLTIVSQPIITNQPASVTNSAGGTATFNIVAGGTGPLHYQWFSVIASVTNSVGGTTTNSALVLSNLTTGQAGNYFAVITNLYGRATSSVATLTVNAGSPPSFVVSPTNFTAFIGRSAAFSVSATGTEPVSYQWRKNGTNLVGATQTNLALAAVTMDDAGVYDAVASNAAGTNGSAAATLTVVARPILQALGVQAQNFRMSLTVVPNLAYDIEYATNAAGPWLTLTNLPPVTVTTNLTIPDAITISTARFYRVHSP